MSLKLVDLDAERPNTGAALSTWLDNAIAGVPELCRVLPQGRTHPPLRRAADG